MKPLSNKFTYTDKTFQLATINKQHCFYYRITRPIEVWGNYHTQIAFYDRSNSLIYHRKDCFAHALKINNSLEFVLWSDTGNEVLFYEYKRGHISKGGIYHYVLINLVDQNIYRIDLYKHKHKFLDEIQNEFSTAEIIKEIESLGIEKESCFTDKIFVSPLKWLWLSKWKPSGRL